MTSRAEHLAWCKQRALAIVDAGDVGGALASMTSDLGKWEGGDLYDPHALRLMVHDGMMFRRTVADMRNWIEGFN